MNDLKGVIHEFLAESYENLDQLDRDFIVLESNPDDRDKLASIFRTIHTIKGTCGFLGFSKLGELTHAGENLLGLLREGKLDLRPDVTSILLAMVDAVRDLLTHIEKFNEEGEADHCELIRALDALRDGNAGGAQYFIASTASPAHESSEGVSGTAVACRSPEPRLSASDCTIRVEVDVLNRLMNLVGELVLARNQLLQFSARETAGRGGHLASATQRLNLITKELQQSVMKTRMQPIRNIWQRFPRVVRDLAGACGKRVLLAMEGEETELDKTLIEAIRDPLTHLVRNAVDHGLESPEVRIACGKPPEGRLLLRACHEGGQITIEISDDGSGIKLDAVRQKAIEKGLVSRVQTDRMSEGDVLNLVFAPGFSTAGRVTNVSGRGVGMDVVKTNIEKIGGTIEIQSAEDRGTTVRMRIPLTLAIIPALMVNSGGERFALPQTSLLELVRLEPEAARRSIERIYSTQVYRRRGRLLPLIHLDRKLGLAPAESFLDQGTEAINILVLQSDGRQFGLVVDQIHNTEEIVVKPLGQQLKSIPAYAGATILGDGRVALILDVQGLFQAADVVVESAQDQPEQPLVCLTQLQLLACELRDGDRVALPLEAIERLEEFPRSAIERIGKRRVVQYRGEIMPLLDVRETMPRLRTVDGEATLPAPADDERLRNDDGPVCLVVHRARSGPVGLVVGRILDVVRVPSDQMNPPQRPGSRATFIADGRVTELLDTTGLIDFVMPAIDSEVSGVAVENR